MFYSASKAITFVLQPSSLLVLLIVAGLILTAWPHRLRLARRLIAAGAVGLFVAGVLPAGNLLILPLEERYAGVAQPADGGSITGIIMLGGFEDGWISQGRGGAGLNEAAERLTEGVRLALKHPERVTGLIVQNGNAYDEGLKEFWDPIKAYWADGSPARREALGFLVDAATTKFQYTDGVADVSRIDPDNWVHDQALLDRPGNKDIQLDLFHDYGTNVPLYPQFQAFFRERQDARYGGGKGRCC